MRTVNEVLAQINIAQQRINEIYVGITNEIIADVDLSDLTSTSKTAEFNLWKYIWAVMAYIQEALWGEAKAEIQAISDNASALNDLWFQQEIFKFQYGDALLVDLVKAKYYYAVIDESKQIIKRCSITRAGGLTTIKVAKETAGLPVELAVGELNAIKSYADRIQPTGGNIQLVSLPTDLLDGPMTIYYDGVIPLDDLKPLVQEAYLNYLAKLKFNGEYNLTRHQDAIQAVPNINDVVLGNIQAKPNSGSYAPVVRVYFPSSGYIQRDGSIDFDVMLTYVPQ